MGNRATPKLIGTVSELPITFTADPNDMLQELRENNNALTIASPGSAGDPPGESLRSEEGP